MQRILVHNVRVQSDVTDRNGVCLQVPSPTGKFVHSFHLNLMASLAKTEENLFISTLLAKNLVLEPKVLVL